MKKRIAFISIHASPLALLGGVDSGGQNVYVSELSEELAASGYLIDIYTRKDKRDLPDVVQWKPGIRVIHIKAGPEASLPKENLLGFINEFIQNALNFITKNYLTYALTHANFFMSAMVADVFKKKLAIPYVVTFHALGYVRRLHQGNKDKFPGERITIEKDIIKNADRIIAECPQDKEDMISYYDAEPKRLMVIPCGFDPREFYPMDKRMARMLLKLEENEKYILQLGRMVPRKGVDNVIRAAGRLWGLGVKVKLLVVGGASEQADIRKEPEIKRLRKIAKENSIDSEVIFFGRKNRLELKYFYAAADLFITTPWYEPFGITPLEAMACGTPVIGSNVGGIKYTVQDGKTGLLVPPNDPVTLADKVLALYGTPGLMKRMQRNALRRVNSFFTWSSVGYSMKKLYEQVLEEAYSITEIEKAG